MVSHILKTTTAALLLNAEVSLASPDPPSQNKTECLAIALRAGGVKGIYEVGVLQALYDKVGKDKIAYDVAVGTSIGSVNAGIIAMFPKGQETQAYKMLYDEWNNSTTANIFREWPRWGPIAGLWEPSLFDSTPTHDRVNEKTRKYPLQREFVFQSVNANDGRIVWFDQNNTPKELQGEAIAASSSIPVAFQPTTSFGDMHLIDGGTFSYMNMQSAINKCRNLTNHAVDDSAITIDMILDQDVPILLPSFSLQASASTLLSFLPMWVTYMYSMFPSMPLPQFNPLRILHRVHNDFKAYYSTMDDVLPIVRMSPDINYRYMVAPTENLPGSSVPIFIKPDEQQDIYNIGYKDAETVINGTKSILDDVRKQIDVQKDFILREGFD